jgi:hypothetical protein
MHPGDWIAYYSPTRTFQGKDRCQAFTAIGQIEEDEIEQAALPDGSAAHRRRVRYMPFREAAVQPLIEDLAFIPDKARWGYSFRRGFLEVDGSDFRRIAVAMRVNIDSDPPGPLLTVVDGASRSILPEETEEARRGLEEYKRAMSEVNLEGFSSLAGLARELGVPYVDLTVFRPDAEALQAVPATVARRLNVVPVRKDHHGLFVAMSNVSNIAVHDELRMAARCPIRPVFAMPNAIARAIAICYESLDTPGASQD